MNEASDFFEDDELLDDGDTVIDTPADKPKKEREQAHKWKPESLRAVPWPRCEACGGPPDDGDPDAALQWQRVYGCKECDGVGHAEVPIDDEHYNETARGSDARVVLYAKRYARGVPLFDGCESRDESREPIYLTPETDF